MTTLHLADLSVGSAGPTAAVNEHLWWYVARSSGIVSWAAVTLSVLWGLVCSTRLATGRSMVAWFGDLHRFLGALSVTFLGVHLVGLVGDGYVTFGVVEILVPGASSWNPVAVAWGIVAMYLLIAVEISSLLMRRIPRRLWRVVHTSGFLVYVLATVHTVTAGTDRSHVLLRWAAFASVQLVLALLVLRIMTTRRLKRALRAAATPAEPGPASRTAELDSAAPVGALISVAPVGAVITADRGAGAAPATVDAALAERVEAIRRRRAAAAPTRRDGVSTATDPDLRTTSTEPIEPAGAAPTGSVDPLLAARVEAIRRRRAASTDPVGASVPTGKG